MEGNRFIAVTRSSLPPFDEYVAEISRLWETHWLTNMGEKHHELEAKLEELLGVACVALFTNGHNAIECAIETLGIGSDGRTEVITTPFTFASTTHAITRKGLVPKMADVREDNCTIDPEKVEALITERTAAIMPVHVYGNLCDVDALADIASRHGLPLIYDAAHAFGVTRNGVSAAAFGDVSCFSFHATKVFNTIEGGAVCSKDASLKERLNQWKNFGITGPESVEYAGGNAKMNEFCAAMGLCNLRHLADELELRRKAVEHYRERLDGTRGLRLLTGPQSGVHENYAYMPVEFDPASGPSRDEVVAALGEHNILARKYFYPCTNAFACYEGMLDPAATPVAQRISGRVLTLPLFAGLADEDIDLICNVVCAGRV